MTGAVLSLVLVLTVLGALGATLWKVWQALRSLGRTVGRASEQLAALDSLAAARAGAVPDTRRA